MCIRDRVRAWLRQEKYAAIVRRAFTSEAAAQFFNTKRLEKLLDQHVSGKRDNWRQIWCVFMFLTWYDEYLSLIHIYWGFAPFWEKPPTGKGKESICVELQALPATEAINKRS